jgi:hypothetical protein
MSDPSEPVEAAPKKRRGRRRKDQAETGYPIDGDWNKDVVFNKDESKSYAWVDPLDLGTMRNRGAVQTERTPDGPRSPHDYGTEGAITQGGLTLMEMPIERKEAIEARDRREFTRRFGEERAEMERIAAKAPGRENKFSVERV